MRPSPYDQWRVCPILGWPRVRTCHSSPNYLSRRISGARGFEQRRAPRFGGSPGATRRPAAGTRACRGPGAGAGQPTSRHDR